MSKHERVMGIIYILFHAVVLPFLLGRVLELVGVEFSFTYLNLVYYAISFLLVLVIMFPFLRKSFSDISGKFIRVVGYAVIGLGLYWAVSLGAAMLANNFLPAPVFTEATPNTEAITTAAAGNFGTIFAVTVILAPIVEETIFRGALFGALRTKSRIMAYAVTIIVFAFYHLWQFLVFDFNWTTMLFALRYVPAGIALGWVYEKSGNIWSPILLHAIINMISVVILFG
jgi:membrane protease YdiL (CAAX protease family)